MVGPDRRRVSGKVPKKQKDGAKKGFGEMAEKGALFLKMVLHQQNTGIWVLYQGCIENLYYNQNYKSSWEDLYSWPVINNFILIISSFGVKVLFSDFFYKLWG